MCDGLIVIISKIINAGLAELLKTSDYEGPARPVVSPEKVAEEEVHSVGLILE